MRKILLLLAVVLLSFDASAEAGLKSVLKVRKSFQPEVTAIAQGGVFAQFTTFEVKGVKKGKKMMLNSVRVEICSEGKFGVENTPTIWQIFEKICLIANTSTGNSKATEKMLVSSLTIVESDGFFVDLGTAHWFGNNAKFTVVGIPKKDAFYNQNGRSIGLAVTVVSVSDGGIKKIEASGKFPMIGTEQVIDPNAWAGSVYYGRTTVYVDGNAYPAIYLWGTANVVVKKASFPTDLGKDTKIALKDYSSSFSKEYNCLVDKKDEITACNFYTERELSVKSIEDNGYYLYAGRALYIYSPNSSAIGSLADPNDIVVVGANVNYRFTPQLETGLACFLAGTMVKMADGTEKPIEEIKIGDSVWVGEGKSDKVKGIIRQHDPEWLCIVAGKQSVFTVPDQPFFVVAQEADGKPSPVNEIVYPATMIKVGDIIRNDKGELVAVSAVSHIVKSKVPTWDLVIQKGTFYYAGGFKVHSVMDGRSDEQLSALLDH